MQRKPKTMKTVLEKTELEITTTRGSIEFGIIAAAISEQLVANERPFEKLVDTKDPIAPSEIKRHELNFVALKIETTV